MLRAAAAARPRASLLPAGSRLGDVPLLRREE
jgi:hypothetical protein